MNMAVLCPSEIASRRFMPALKQLSEIDYVGVGVATASERCVGLESLPSNVPENVVDRQFQRAELFQQEHGGVIYKSFEGLLSDKNVDAVYIPLPPGLHYSWASKALEYGKHVLLEKPFTPMLKETQELIATASKKDLVVFENYMFQYHSQIDFVREVIEKGNLGKVRLIRIDFGFPFRGVNDFRYNKLLGGGALLDCGGYTLKLASMFLGPSATISTAQLNYDKELDVDLYGSATLVNDDGLVAQVAFGMDNDYRCDVNVWGSEATLTSGRIISAPPEYEPTVTIRRNGVEEVLYLDPDDSFKNAINQFLLCLQDEKKRQDVYSDIEIQAHLTEKVFEF